jgi:2-polyprenyl-3-methyl-5-hydroxy-6-metoxy-1,4-benzoquinol methylase
MTDTYDYDSIDIGYYDAVFHRNQGMQSKWHQLKFDRIRRELGQPHKHLDIACGPGTFIGSLPESIASTGVDIAAPQIDFAKNAYGRNNVQFQCISAGEMPFEAGNFDAVTSIELIEHLEQDAVAALLIEARRVMSPMGKIIVSTPDYGGVWPAVEWLLNRVGDVSYEDQHINKFNKQRLRHTMKAAGFRNIDVRSYLFAAPFAAALGWGFADIIEKLEPKFLVDRFGLLLIATAEAP